MKTMKFLTHPYTLIASFFFVMISGQHLGGFYLLYLLLALPHGGVHSITALIGITLLLFSYSKHKERGQLTESILNIFGVFLLLLSLFLFFYNDKENYNYGTFVQLVPQITLTIFAVLCLLFLSVNISVLLKRVSQTTS
jgi:hypothetical protein